MRTKLMLAAAAALVAGAISTQAQTAVYSQNIVGYVNQVCTGGNALSVVSNPLLTSTNDAATLLTNLQGGESIYVWDGAGFYIYDYISGSTGPTSWSQDPSSDTIPGGTSITSHHITTIYVPGPQIPPGQAFIVQEPNPSALTNTYVGTVILNATNSLAGGNALSFIGSSIPVAGDLQTNTAVALPFVGGESVYLWDGAGYYIYDYISGSTGPTSWAQDPSSDTIPGGTSITSHHITTIYVPTPQVSVGQGFFVQNPNPTAETWIQNLTVQ